MNPREALDYLSNTYGTSPKALRAQQGKLVALKLLTLTAVEILRDEADDELNRYLEGLASRRGIEL